MSSSESQHTVNGTYYTDPRGNLVISVTSSYPLTGLYSPGDTYEVKLNAAGPGNHEVTWTKPGMTLTERYTSAGQSLPTWQLTCSINPATIEWFFSQLNPTGVQLMLRQEPTNIQESDLAPIINVMSREYGPLGAENMFGVLAHLTDTTITLEARQPFGGFHWLPAYYATGATEGPRFSAGSQKNPFEIAFGHEAGDRPWRVELTVSDEHLADMARIITGDPNMLTAASQMTLPGAFYGKRLMQDSSPYVTDLSQANPLIAAAFQLASK